MNSKNFTPGTLLVISLLIMLFTSCEAIGTIYETGVWSGIIIVVVVIVLIIFLWNRFFRRKG